jgi:hypothetical protein
MNLLNSKENAALHFHKAVNGVGVFLLLVFSLLLAPSASAQIDNTGCVGANFGIDADLYSGLLQFGTHGSVSATGTLDWFQGSTGKGVISQTNAATLQSQLQAGGNPAVEVRMSYPIFSRVDNKLWVDAVYGRDYFGGTGFTDATSYTSSAKNAQDPGIWPTGPANVLGKNDLIDVAGFMLRDGPFNSSDLWFHGLAVRAEPGGSAYLDFEFYVAELNYNSATGFSTGGPDLGHTAFLFDGTGNVTRLGDLIFNTSMINGGTTAAVELRIWVSKATYDAWKTSPPANLPFIFGPAFDGAFNGATFGYASVLPKTTADACGYVNLAGEIPAAGPWGHLGTKTNTWGTTIQEYAVTEIGFNLTEYGLDNSGLIGVDSCNFPYRTFIVKSRSSEAFTAALKDFGGPYAWGKPYSTVAGANALISCQSPSIPLEGLPIWTNATYSWSTVDGNILTSPPTSRIINVDQPGTYVLDVTLENGCPVEPFVAVVGDDATKPNFESVVVSPMVACNVNNGSLSLSVSGGTAPYTYSWSRVPTGFSSTQQNPTGLTAGVYTVTVTDANTCTSTASGTVIAAIRNLSSTITNVSCNGLKDGAIDLTVTGTSSTFTYAWSNGNLTQDISNLGAGSYTVTVTDSYSCTSTAIYTITQPAALTISLVAVNDTDPIAGAANANGSIDLTVNGGTINYTYAWADGPVTEDRTGLARGTYSVTVTDSKGCTVTGSAQIWEPEICNDGIDNDGDNLVDCEDPDCAVPQPGTPTNPAVCVNQTGIMYTVTDNPAVDYLWTVPANAMIVSGQTTNSVEVKWTSSQSGQVCVQAVKDGCSSEKVCVTVSPATVPIKPTTIEIN